MVIKTQPHELQKIFSRVAQERGIEVPELNDAIKQQRSETEQGNSWIDDIDRQERRERLDEKLSRARRKKNYAMLLGGVVVSLLIVKTTMIGLDVAKEKQLLAKVPALLQNVATPNVAVSVAQEGGKKLATGEALFGSVRKKKEVDQATLDLQEAANTPLDQRIENDGEIGSILKENIKGKVQQLSEREQQLKTFEAMLQVTEEKLADKQQALESTRDEIKRLLDDYNNAKEGERGHLVGIFSSLEPKRAAAIFNDLDTDIIVELITQMSPRKASQIMGYMLPSKAKSVTEVLSGRNLAVTDQMLSSGGIN